MAKQKTDPYSELKNTMTIRQQQETKTPLELPAESIITEIGVLIEDVQTKVISYQSAMLYIMLRYGAFKSPKLERTPVGIHSSILEISELLNVSRPFITSAIKDLRGAGYADISIESSKGVIVTWKHR